MASHVAFGRYLLVERLASGGMAEIFLAKARGEAGFERTCVIKRILPHLALMPDFVAMFLDEARIAARLHHPGIAQIFDLGREGDSYYLAMEYLPGEDVSEILGKSHARRAAVPLDVAARIVSSAAEALQYAHDAVMPDGRPLGIVHRDISPSNLFVTYLGAVKVLDFGIARAEERLQETRAGTFKGKLSYMSPEQSLGEEVDRRSDVWSLGVCLYELITGRRLFAQEPLPEAMEALRSGRIPPPSESRPEVPTVLEQAVMGALERDPARRFATARAFRDALESFLADRTYVPASTQLSQFLEELFGAERARARLRLAQDPAATVGALGPKRAPTASIGSDEPPPPPTEVNTRQERPTDTRLETPATALLDTAPPPVGRPPRAGAPVGVAAALVGVAAVAVAGWALWPTPSGVSHVEHLGGVENAKPLSPPAPPPPAPLPVAVTAPRAVEPVPVAATTPRAVEPVPVEVAPPPRRAEAKLPAPGRRVARADSEEPRAEPRGWMTVQSNVAGTVSIDDVAAGAAPLVKHPLAAGEHRLLFENHALGLRRAWRASVEDGKESVERVNFGKGRLNVQATPWADVWLDQRSLGQTPLAGEEVWEGRHSLRLVGERGEKSVVVEVAAGHTTVVKEQLP